MVSTTLPPLQTAGAAGDTTSGNGLTSTVTEAVDVHPFTSPVTVYVVVLSGFAVTLGPVVELKFIAGLHV